MKLGKAICWTLMLCGLFSGCQPPIDPAPRKSDILYPTGARLTGTWTGETSRVPRTVAALFQVSEDEWVIFTGPGITTTTAQITFGAGTYRSRATSVSRFLDGSDASTSYTDQDGVYSVQGDSLSVTIQRERTSSQPFQDEEAGWSSLEEPLTRSRPAILYHGLLYGIGDDCKVWKATGPHQDALGEWTAVTYTSSEALPYVKQILRLHPDDTVSVGSVASSSATFTTEPSPSITGTQSAADGRLTLSLDGGITPFVRALAVWEDYLVWSHPDDPGAGAFHRL